MNTINIKETVIAHPSTSEQSEIIKSFFKSLKIKFEVSKPYNSDFVKKIKKSENQYKNGKYTRIDAADIEKYIDSL